MFLSNNPLSGDINLLNLSCLIGTCPMGKAFSHESTIISMEKISYSLKLLSGHFMGNPPLRLS